MSPELRQLRRLRERGLEQTSGLWPGLRHAFGWVHQAAHILKNADGTAADQVEDRFAALRFAALIATIAQNREQAGTLAGAVDHFRAVTARYRPGLFHCYRVSGLPRTNHALEQCFGSHRHHDRRATGRKTASPSLVLRGPVRILAAAATRRHPFAARDLARVDHQRWTALRRSLEDRRHGRALRTRFRRTPEAYLAQLERQFLQPALPP